jgi:hypothetical protein
MDLAGIHNALIQKICIGNIRFIPLSLEDRQRIEADSPRKSDNTLFAVRLPGRPAVVSSFLDLFAFCLQS